MPIPVAAFSVTTAPAEVATMSVSVSPPSVIAPPVEVTFTASEVAFFVVRPPSAMSPAAESRIVPAPASTTAPSAIVIPLPEDPITTGPVE